MGLKILWTGDSPTVDTGFGIVSRNILNRLVAKGYEANVLGINHYGLPYDQKEFPYLIYPCDKGGYDEIFGVHKLWQIYEMYQPDLIFFLNDPWIIENQMAHAPKNLKAKTIAYFPTDGGPLKKSWLKMLENMDAAVCYSHYAERTITSSNDGKPLSNLHQIYHGINTEVFKPVHQSIARKRLGLPEDAFIVGMVARNQYRKRFDLLLKAFVEFAADKPEAMLYFHTSPKDIGFDILDMVSQFKMRKNQLILTDGVHPAKGVPEEQLNIIYNSFDVNALISLGDGFGLPVAESMATGVPQLVSGHSALQELVDGHGGFTVKTQAWLMNIGGFNTWGGLSDVDDIVDKLNILYNSKELRISLAEDGYSFITQPQFTWDYATNQFNNIIREIFHLL